MIRAYHFVGNAPDMMESLNLLPSWSPKLGGEGARDGTVMLSSESTSSLMIGGDYVTRIDPKIGM